VVAGDYERGRHEHDPGRGRVPRAREDVGDERREHDGARAVAARIRVVEGDDVDRPGAVRPVDVRSLQPELADELGRVGREPRREPDDRRDDRPAPRESRAQPRDDECGDEERSRVHIRAEQLVPPDRVERERPPQPGHLEHTPARVRIERRHHVVDRPIVDPGQRAADDEDGEDHERARHNCDPAHHRPLTVACGEWTSWSRSGAHGARGAGR
jgi:hypothetical protein